MNDIAADLPQVKGLPSSIEVNGETVLVLVVPLTGDPRISKSSACGSKIIDTFRMPRVASVSFLMNRSVAPIEFSREQCSREIKEAGNKPGTHLIAYITLLLKCIRNEENAARIKVWLEARVTGEYRYLDFRLFELAFSQSVGCKDQKDFAAYYECFAEAISKVSLPGRQAANPAEAKPDSGPAAPLSENRAGPDREGAAPIGPGSGNSPDVEPSARPVSAQKPPNEDGSPIKPDAPPNGDAGGRNSQDERRARSEPIAAFPREPASTSTLTDYLILFAMLGAPLIVLTGAFVVAYRRMSPNGRGFDREPAADEAPARSLSQEDSGANYGATDSSAPLVTANRPVSEPIKVQERNDSIAVQELTNKMKAMELQIGEFKHSVATREREAAAADEKSQKLLDKISALETEYRRQISELNKSLTTSDAQRNQAIRERDDLIKLRDELTGRANDITRQRDDLAREREDLTRQGEARAKQLEELAAQHNLLEAERDALRKERDDLATERDGLRKQRDELADRLNFINSETERLKSGLPSFLSPADLGNPLSEFWVASAKTNPQAHSRLEGALRSYKIASDAPFESGGRIFELVNDIGVQLYTLMDAIEYDEPQKREIAANWQAALNADGERRFIISVPWPGTAIDSSQMVRKDQRCRSERISHVHSWVVKDKDGRVARRAIVE